MADELSLESLSKRVAEYHTEMDRRFTEVQTELNSLRSRVETAIKNGDTRLVRLTNLLDSMMDNFQQVITAISNLAVRLDSADKSYSKLQSSSAITKKNLNDLSSYFKQMDKTWRQAMDEIEKLKESDKTNTKFRNRVIYVGSVILVGLLGVGRADIVEKIINFFLTCF